MFSIISVIAGAVGGIAKSWLENKKVKAEGKIAISKAKIDAQVQHAANLHELDRVAAGDMRYSWKDEWFVVLLSIPVIMCFIPIPAVQEAALNGFETLKQTPEWFRWAFLGAIVASFGLRTWFSKFNGKV